MCFIVADIEQDRSEGEISQETGISLREIAASPIPSTCCLCIFGQLKLGSKF